MFILLNLSLSRLLIATVISGRCQALPPLWNDYFLNIYRLIIRLYLLCKYAQKTTDYIIETGVYFLAYKSHANKIVWKEKHRAYLYDLEWVSWLSDCRLAALWAAAGCLCATRKDLCSNEHPSVPPLSLISEGLGDARETGQEGRHFLWSFRCPQFCCWLSASIS